MSERLIDQLRPCVDCGFLMRSEREVARCGDCAEYGPPRPAFVPGRSEHVGVVPFGNVPAGAFGEQETR